tara:strand:- start:456 stop:1202 length:747 start_codon:yes stop_codon:yes gene_type:complete
MKFSRLLIFSFLLVVIVFSIFGLQPFKTSIDAKTTLVKETESYKTEVRRLPDASYLVAVRTPMLGVKAEMVRWWFADFLNTTEHYTWWHPEDHVWMDWENKKPGEVIGSSHLVHEYIGSELSKLRIQFIDSSEFFGFDPNNKDTFVICAKVGLLEEEINTAKMCHVVRNTETGAEMRSRFWLGHVAKRDGNKTIRSFEGFVGNMALVRLFLIEQQVNPEDLKRHAIEEMTYLTKLLPSLYKSENEYTD